MEKQYISINKAAKMFGVSTQTLRNWEKKGLVQSIRSPGNQRLFSIQDLRCLSTGKEINKKKTTVIYARVSSTKQKSDGNLDRQVERLKAYAEENNYDVIKIFKEQASGINEKRKQLQNIFKMAENQEFSVLLIEFPDRLARFGYEYIKSYLSSHNIEIIASQKTEPKSSQEELVEDLITIVTVFSARMYGKRSHEFKNKVKKTIEEMG